MDKIAPALAAELNAAAPAQYCNFEMATLTGRTLTVGGWFSEKTAKNTSPAGYVRLRGPGGDYAAPLPVNRPRPDVQTYFKGPPAVAESGFNAVFDIKALASGAYTPLAYRRDPKGWISCTSPVTLTAP
jgi:hypothetical protein